MNTLYAQYGKLLVEIERLKKEARIIKKRIDLSASSTGKSLTKYHGVRSKIAAELGLKPSTVKQVMSGRGVSAKIASAVSQKVSEIDRLSRSKRYRQLTPEQLSECSGGGKYFGLFSRVSKIAGISDNSIRKAAMGITKSQRCLRPLHEEIARIDSLPPSDFPRPFEAARMKQFSRGGAYYGQLAKLARQFETNPSTIYQVAKGTVRSRRLLKGITEELDKIDLQGGTL